MLNFGVNEVSGSLPVTGGRQLNLGSPRQGAWLAITDRAPDGPIEGAPFEIPLAASSVLDGMTAKSHFGRFAKSQPATAEAMSTPASRRMARNDVDGDRRADLLWAYRFGGYDALLSIWFMDGSALRGGRYFEDANPAFDPDAFRLPLGVGDLDGNGVAEVVVREYDQGNGSLYAFSAVGPDYTQARAHKFVPHGYPYGWRMAAIMDMNGDGRSNLGWVPDRFYLACETDPQPGRDQLSRWYLDDGALLGGRLDDMGACQTNKFRNDLPGDFDGDGVGDFAVVTGSTISILLTGDDGSPARSGDDLLLPPRWGGGHHTGDLNGDGKSDLILFEDPASGPQYVHIWFMDGAQVIGIKSEPVPRPWNRCLSAVADFDGNGYDDLVWTWVNDASSNIGHVAMWRTMPDGNFQGSYVGSYPDGWRVINSTY